MNDIKKKFRKGDKVRMTALALRCNLDGAVDAGGPYEGVVTYVGANTISVDTGKWRAQPYNPVYWEVYEKAPLPLKPKKKKTIPRNIIDHSKQPDVKFFRVREL